MSEQNIPKSFRKTFDDANVVAKIRMFVMLLVTLVAYGATIYLLFFQESILSSLIALFIFFVFFHFAYLELHEHPVRKILMIVGGFTLLELLLLGFHTWQVPSSVLLFNIAVVLLANRLHSGHQERRKFSAWGYFTVGGYFFTMLMTITYSLFLV
ncbi:MAG: hypothetical protein GXP45_02715 [bacterium]|nr:hypothetical protein [bacterium]